MADPPGGPGQTGETGIPELVADRSADDRPAAGSGGSAGGVAERLFHVREIVADEEKLLDLGHQEVDETLAGLRDRTPAELPGVDTSAIRRADPEFDEEAFRAIARETFYKVREARRLQNPPESAELLSPQMQGELQNAISGDVAAHRHHLLPFLTVKDAVIAGTEVVAGREQIDVLFSISAIEEDLDDRSGQVMAGDTSEHSWEERWRFARDPQADTSASDERHEITLDRTGQWMVAHRGWTVTQIERLPAS